MADDLRPDFFRRVSGIPIVSSALAQMSSAYSRTKGRNLVAWVACQACEIGLQTAAVTARPILSILERPVGRLNAVACERLSQLGLKYPEINRPVDELLASTKQKFSSFLALKSPVYDLNIAVTAAAVSSERDYSIEIDAASDESSQDTDDHSGVLPFVDSSVSEPIFSSQCLLPTVWLSPFSAFVALMYSLDGLDCKRELTTGKVFSLQTQFLQLVRRVGDVTLCARCRILPAQFSGCANVDSASERLCLACWLVWCLQRQMSAAGAVSVEAVQRLFQRIVQWLVERVHRSITSLEEVCDLILDWLTGHPPLLWILPQMNDGREFDDLEGDDFDVANLAGHIRYVPVHPNDMAAHAPLTPRRVYWRRRF